MEGASKGGHVDQALKPGASSDVDALRTVLVELHGSLRDIEFSIVISGDGLPMVTLSEDGDADAAGGACAALLHAARAAARDLYRGEPKQILLIGSEGDVVLIPAGSEATLAVLVRPGCNLGLLFLEARRAAAAIAAMV